jgi:type VI secretion system Hcp family effector
MAEGSSDILMNMVLGTSAIQAECASSLSNSPLLQGFTPGRFFEVLSMSMGFSKPDTSSIAGVTQGAASAPSPITITRKIDKASTTLMDCCFGGKSLASATIVKRRASGTQYAAEPYLKIACTGVLITEISWQDEHMVNETFSFICRKLEFIYHAQTAAGSHIGDFKAQWEYIGSGALKT